MQAQLGLMAILAHPDDESMGTGGILAKYAAEGVETYLVTATRGERGWWGEKDEYAGPEAVGDTREQELRAAAEVLGLKEVNLLGYLDKELDQADPAEVIRKLVTHLIDTVDHWKTIWQAIACQGAKHRAGSVFRPTLGSGDRISRLMDGIWGKEGGKRDRSCRNRLL